MPVPADPATVGAYLASLGETHAPTTIRRRLAAIGKMHRFNDLPWNAAHRDIQAPLQGVLRQHGRPVQKAAALTLDMLRELVASPRSTGKVTGIAQSYGVIGASLGRHTHPIGYGVPATDKQPKAANGIDNYP